ncbi:MAG: hypothetical protein JWO26_343 [Rhodospirillales bacterium]|nr:hypothetical protein [Rhodospirillales bacterium]
MRRALVMLMLLAPAALAQAPSRQATAEARQAELERLFVALADASDEAGGALVEARIRSLWQESVTAAVGLLVRRGLRNLQGRAAEEALEDFDAAITLEPTAAELWHLRAQAYAMGGDLVAAAQDLREALRLEPRHFPALLMLAGIQDQRGDAVGALRSFSAALAIHPKLRGGVARLRELRRKAEGDDT